MTKQYPTYTTQPSTPDTLPLPERAYNLARRFMDIERRHHGRVRIQIDLLMIDGEWWIEILQPGRLERLGE